MLAKYNKILPKIVVHATTLGRCCSESSFSSFYIRYKQGCSAKNEVWERRSHTK